MKLQPIISLLVCFCLIFLSCGFTSISFGNQNSADKTEENVITESDAGGGSISTNELLAILVVTVGVIIIIAIAA